MVCNPDNVILTVVATTQDAFASNPCATVSTYSLLAMSVDAAGVVLIVPVLIAKLVPIAAPMFGVVKFGLDCMTNVLPLPV